MTFLSAAREAPRMMIFCALLAIIALAGGIALGLGRMEERDSFMKEELSRQGRIIAETVRLDNLSALSGYPEDLAKPEYLRLKEQLGAVLQAFPAVRKLTLAGRRPDGSLFLYVDSEPLESGPDSGPGKNYDKADSLFLSALEEKGAVVAGPVSDGEGTRVFSLSPLLSPDANRREAILILDGAGENWQKTVRAAAVLPVAAGIALAVAFFGAWPVLALRTRLRYGEAGLVLLIGLILTLSVALMIHERENFDRGRAFTAIAGARSGKLNNLFENIRNVALMSLVRYMESSEEVREDEFEYFIKHLENLPEVMSAAWIPAPGSGAGFDWPHEEDQEAMELAAAAGLPSSSEVRLRPGPEGGRNELRIFKSVHERDGSRRLMGLTSFSLDLDSFLTKATLGGERDLVMRLWELTYGEAAPVAGPFGPALSDCFGGMDISADLPLCSIRPIFAFGRTFVAEMLPGPDFLLHHPLSHGLPALLTGLFISLSASGAAGVAFRHREMLERKVAERTAELRKSMDRLLLADNIFRTTTEGIVITDADGLIEDGNLALERLTGYTLEEVRGKRPDIFGAQQITPDAPERFWDMLKKDGAWQGETLNRRKSGEVYPVWLTISGVRDSRGNITHYAGSLTHIGDIKAEQQRLSHLAYHDPLTDLPNRYLLMDRLEMAIARARRAHVLAAAVFIDLDGFKAVNDTYGHETGDLLLMSVAKRLTEAVREQDTVARLGGDEFVAVLDGFSATGEIELLIKRICAVFYEPFKAGKRLISIKGSVGTAVFPDDGATAGELIARADELMYARKLEKRSG